MRVYQTLHCAPTLLLGSLPLALLAFFLRAAAVREMAHLALQFASHLLEHAAEEILCAPRSKFSRFLVFHQINDHSSR